MKKLAFLSALAVALVVIWISTSPVTANGNLIVGADWTFGGGCCHTAVADPCPRGWLDGELLDCTGDEISACVIQTATAVCTASDSHPCEGANPYCHQAASSFCE